MRRDYKKTILTLVIIIFTTGCQSPSLNKEQNSTFDSYTQKFINSDVCDQIIDNAFMTICYDYEKKVAKAVAYTLQGDLVNETNIAKRPNFYSDVNIPTDYQAKESDYRNSGYDRGHLAPDASFDWSEESLDATYSLANVIPQVPSVNRYAWATLEAYARDMAVEKGELFVLNVVKYGTPFEVIGENQLVLSEGYYKILYAIDYEACFYYENSDDSSMGNAIDAYRISCESVAY